MMLKLLTLRADDVAEQLAGDVEAAHSSLSTSSSPSSARMALRSKTATPVELSIGRGGGGVEWNKMNYSSGTSIKPIPL